jgi:hypothetical protein
MRWRRSLNRLSTSQKPSPAPRPARHGRESPVVLRVEQRYAQYARVAQQQQPEPPRRCRAGRSATSATGDQQHDGRNTNSRRAASPTAPATVVQQITSVPLNTIRHGGQPSACTCGRDCVASERQPAASATRGC